jgi:hypothetical protein
MLGLLMTDELRSKWNEADVAYLKVLSKHWPGRAEEKPTKCQSVWSLTEPKTRIWHLPNNSRKRPRQRRLAW